MTDSNRIKTDMVQFYADEARDRDSQEWLLRGGSARVPESKASHYFIDRKVGEALRLAALPREARVLEVGCSFGHMTFLLTRHFREVLGVDLSPESLELARRRAGHYGVSNVRFALGDAEELRDIGDGSFDGVFSFSTLRFCPHPGRMARELARVVKPGGRVVLDVPNRNCPWYGPLKRAARIDPHIHDRLYTAGEVAALLRESGLTDVRTKQLLFTTKRTPAPLLPAFRVLDRILEALPGVRTWSGIVMAAGVRPWT